MRSIGYESLGKVACFHRPVPVTLGKTHLRALVACLELVGVGLISLVK